MKKITRLAVIGFIFLIIKAYADDNAVIISPTRYGKKGSERTTTEIWNDCFLGWEMLYIKGWQDNNIHVLYRNGEDEEPVHWRYQAQQYNLPQITDNSAFTQDVEQIFDWLAGQMTSQDLLFCFLNGHGNEDGIHAYIVLQDYDMRDNVFAGHSDQVPYDSRVFWITLCYGGGFIDDLRNNSTVVITPCEFDEECYTADDLNVDGSPTVENEENNDHNEFNFHIMNAVRGEKIYPYDNPPEVDADNNDDGKVSMEEAFIYAEANDSRHHYWGWETPQKSDLGNIGSNISLDLLEATVTYPNGGETLKNFATYKITWEATYGHPIVTQSIYYSTNGGDSWKKIADLDGSPRFYNWMIPRSQSSSSTCRVKVTLQDEFHESYDISDDDFTIWQFYPYLSGVLRANGEVVADLHWSWGPGPYYLDHYELWRNKVVIYSGTGTSYIDPLPFKPSESRQYRVDVIYRKTPGGSTFDISSNEVTLTHGGGCPYLFSWNGTEFLEDNNILAGSGQEDIVTDLYKLTKPLLETEPPQRYKFEIREEETEHSFFDMVSLITIDHPEDVEIGINMENEFVPITTAHTPLSAISGDNDYVDVLSNDTSFFEGCEGDTMVVEFGAIEDVDNKELWLNSDKRGYPISIEIEIEDNWEYITSVFPRENFSTTPIASLTEFIEDGDTFTIRLVWFADHNLKTIRIVQIEEISIKEKTAPLTSATHSRLGDVKQELLNEDEVYAEVLPSDTLRLEFAVTNQIPGWNRSFIFISNGYYATGTGKNGGTQTAEGNLPSIHSLLVYPNPARNDLSTKLAIPKEEKVSLKIFDVSGREVKTLVDKRLKAGYHIIRLDDIDLPSGIYFARLVTDSYKETKKLLVVR